MNIKISLLALLWKRIWGGKEAVFDYFVDKGNTLVAALPGATKEKLKKAYEIAQKIYGYMVKLEWVVPAKWVPYYTAVMSCFKAILNALDDAQITSDEITKLVAEFQTAYALWKADDVDECDNCHD